MAQATSFVFNHYSVENDGRSATFSYSVRLSGEDPLHFTEHLRFPAPLDPANPVIDHLLTALHIGLGISYYKLFLPPRFEMGSLHLSASDADFWNEVYLMGLGEFLYVNKLGPDRVARFSAIGDSPAVTSPARGASKAILALGGGKDSIVAGELLRALSLEQSAFVLGTGEHPGQTAAIAKDMGLELFGVNRTLDPLLLELNTRGDTYNGHVPISMVFALCGLVVAAATGAKYMVVGNEATASLPNTEWEGLSVNHQWSKSFAFEKALQAYVTSSISPDLWYFSAIRPFSSVAVAKLFSRYPKYLADFTSCNRVFLMDPAKRPKGHWCTECAKCLSSFIILAPWLDESTLVSLFTKNMLDDTAQIPQFLALTGIEGHKPLDCVGSEEEMILSLNLLARQGKFTGSALMRIGQERGLIRDGDWQATLKASLEVGGEHSFPPELSDKLLGKMKELLA